MGGVQRVVRRMGLADAIDANVSVLKIHKPYHESDHVLNIAYNVLCGGERLEDIELRRNDRVMLDALGTASLPDPTTAGDFCRRFDGQSIDGLMEGINETRPSLATSPRATAQLGIALPGEDAPPIGRPELPRRIASEGSGLCEPRGSAERARVMQAPAQGQGVRLAAGAP